MVSYRHILDKKANFIMMIKTGESGNTFVATSCYKDSICKWLVPGGISSLLSKSASMTVRLSACILYAGLPTVLLLSTGLRNQNKTK